jgi:hypothetical protein
MRTLTTTAAALALGLAAAAQAQEEDAPRVVDITGADKPPIENAENVIPEEEAELKAETGLASPSHTAPTPGEGGELAAVEESESATGITDFPAPEGFSAADMGMMDPTELLGVRVYSAQDERVGEIDRWLGEAEGGLPEGAVVEIGGFLGMADREVAIETERLSLLTDDDGNDLRVYVDMTADELEALPDLD